VSIGVLNLRPEFRAQALKGTAIELATRNTPRYLLPRAEEGNIYLDSSIVILARAVMTAASWRGDNAEYGKLDREFRNQLHEAILKRYSRLPFYSAGISGSPRRRSSALKT
jgi:hypothetical protein